VTSLQILRNPFLTSAEYAGCVSAFVDSLSGELNAAATCLRRLEGTRKGSEFAHEVGLDRGRYGALMVLDRWRHLSGKLSPRLRGDERLREMIEQAEERVASGETILARANAVLDAAGTYESDVVAAALLAFQQAAAIFRQEAELAEREARLGPMMPEEQRTARAVFLADLARR